MNNKYINIPNCLSVFRLLGALSLIMVEPLSVIFYMIYTLCGISDVLDGYIARKYNSCSEFGAKLDSVADLTFYGIMLVKLFDILKIKMSFEMKICVLVIIFLRMLSYGTAALKFHQFASVHTYMNKLTGFCVFFLPYILSLTFVDIMIWVMIVIAIIAACEEWIIHLTGEKNQVNRQSILRKGE